MSKCKFAKSKEMDVVNNVLPLSRGQSENRIARDTSSG